MSALKEMFTEELLSEFGKMVQTEYAAFDVTRFMAHVFDEEWNKKELKQRVAAVTKALRATLPPDYPAAIGVLDRLTDRCRGMKYWFFPDFIEKYGLEHWDLSMYALERFTVASTSEFAVRPFIVKDKERMMAQMLAWSEHPNHHVRRLASEGCRPRLPWGMALADLKKDPSPIIPILERLKEDDSDYVRKSVANNLNDISKDHPGVVLELARRWYGRSPQLDWVVKHGSRTLLKQGNPDALALFGVGAMDSITAKELSVAYAAIAIGEEQQFSFTLTNSGEEPALVRLEYEVEYVKARGGTSRKVFKLSERMLPPGETLMTRRHSFADVSVRKHYPGTHSVTLVINGERLDTVAFEVTPDMD